MNRSRHTARKYDISRHAAYLQREVQRLHAEVRDLRAGVRPGLWARLVAAYHKRRLQRHVRRAHRRADAARRAAAAGGLVLLLLAGCASPTEPCQTTTSYTADQWQDSTIVVPITVTYCLEHRGMVP